MSYFLASERLAVFAATRAADAHKPRPCGGFRHRLLCRRSWKQQAAAELTRRSISEASVLFQTRPPESRPQRFWRALCHPEALGKSCSPLAANTCSPKLWPGGVVFAGAAAVFRWCDILIHWQDVLFSDFGAVCGVCLAARTADAHKPRPCGGFRQRLLCRRSWKQQAKAELARRSLPKLLFYFRRDRQKAARSVSGLHSVILTL